MCLVFSRVNGKIYACTSTRTVVVAVPAALLLLLFLLLLWLRRCSPDCGGHSLAASDTTTGGECAVTYRRLTVAPGALGLTVLILQYLYFV